MSEEDWSTFTCDGCGRKGISAFDECIVNGRPEPCPFCGNGSPGTGWRVRYEVELADGMEDLRLKGRVHAGVWCSCGASVEVRMEPDDVYHDIQCIATGLWNRRAVG